MPFLVTLIGENHYECGDGYTRYSLKMIHTFPGELRYRSGKKAFTLVADPAHWQGLNKTGMIDGFGQICARTDDNGVCQDLRKFHSGQVQARKTASVYLAELS